MSRQSLNHLLIILLPLLVLGAGIAVRIVDPLPLQQVRQKVFDTYQRITPRAFEPGPVIIADIDEKSLQELGQWPWPRPVLAAMVGRLLEAGAATVAFDVVFAEPDRTSPRAMLETWQSTTGMAVDQQLMQSGFADLPDHDAILAEAIRGQPVVLGFVGAPVGSGVSPVKRFGLAYAGDDPAPFVPFHSAAVTNLPGLEDASAGVGSFNTTPDSDNVIRRLPTFIRIGDELFPSLAMESLRVAQGAAAYTIRTSGASGQTAFGEQTGLNAVRTGGITAPVDGAGNIILYDTGSRAERYVSIADILSPTFDTSLVEGRIVLVGASAPGLKDQRASPLQVAVPGVELHAQIIEQMAFQQFLERPDYATAVEVTFLLGLGLTLAAGFHVRRLGAVWLAVLAIAGIAAGGGFSWNAFNSYGHLYDPVYPGFALIALYIIGSLLRFIETEGQKRQIRDAFSHYMSPAMVARLAENPGLLKLGGEMRDLTILFCDIRGFTTISEQFNAEELTSFINRFLTPMTDIIMSTGGTIDKYMGDCIMAFWNAPLDDPEHERHACGAALRMLAEVQALNVRLKDEMELSGRKHIPVKVGVGLNSGIVCVGNMGADQRFDYSCLGDDVNLASRLEGQCKTYGVDIVLGENTQIAVLDLATIELDLIQVKGKTAPVRIFAHLGDEALAARDDFKAFQARHDAMLAHFRAQEWDEMQTAIDECRQLMAPVAELGILYDLFQERLDDFRANPPGDDWDGVYISQSK